MTLPDLARHDLSLMHGWLPVAVQILAAAAVIVSVGWRTRRWRLVWVPWAAAVGGGLAFTTYCYIRSAGVADGSAPAPPTLWVWITLCGMAFGLLIAGWRGARWWRRTAAALAVPLCALAAALALNLWTGYFPTVDTAWNQLTASPVPDQTDQVVVAALQKRHAVPIKGSVVPVQIPATASGFRHRQEFVYLPPAWFGSDPPPALPVVMMIGGEFNTPADWLRAGGAVEILDDFAAAHRGYAPVAVFVDPGGTFDNDTECVNGTRGNAADHLVKDVVPYLRSQYGVRPPGAGWGIVGWSMGGTCAVDLTVMHPEVFTAFVDIAGDAAPNAGTPTETVQRLFGGDAAAYAAFDPAQVMARRAPYRGVAGVFAVNRVPGSAAPNDQAVAAGTLCAAGERAGIACAVVSRPGNHDWPFASTAFATSLPWLAARIDTPGVARTVFPGTLRG